MPIVYVQTRISAPPAATWKVVCDLEQYPRYMTDVRSIVTSGPPVAGIRTSSWSVSLRGSILEWTERDQLDEQRLRVEFEQLDGDLERFSGYWQIRPVPNDRQLSDVFFYVDFEIGIPLLADMLNPIAKRSLQDNSVRMLGALEDQIRQAA
ncbi:MAG: type II toxin-antitoxin system RatA family toxin [Frankia sp.]